MYIVIFTALPGEQDHAYITMATRLRELALTDYGCLGFTPASSATHEIALSYWPSLDHIHRWKQQVEHLEAQAQGQRTWYQGYRVEIAEIKHSYSFGQMSTSLEKE